MKIQLLIRVYKARTEFKRMERVGGLQQCIDLAGTKSEALAYACLLSFFQIMYLKPLQINPQIS